MHGVAAAPAPRALQVKGPADLTVTTLPDPVPAATNFFDLLQIRGKYQHQPPFAWISGMGFAGGAYATLATAKEDVLHAVLVHAGAGGVGLAAAGTAAKSDVCRRFGADHGVDYGSARVLELTGGRGVDVVFDPVGMVEASLKCVAWNGRVLVAGSAGGGGRD
ncbi:uncharacterized protein H6S33_003522 [Morchella sextelata]|uniref:uncharacterized protein n=1 Tax=Morchella sextelata TaxID=1174677 RepID=UPI001D05A916|nr:uncharacterized protein H6S33_003522 [Morchella sextelata]KAH0606688.1 hypothetical protein H6S33_003522 [Morchella sextelata]